MVHMLPPAAVPASVSKAASRDTFASRLPPLESPGDSSDLVQILSSVGRADLNFQHLLLVLCHRSEQLCPVDVGIGQHRIQCDAPPLLLETLQSERQSSGPAVNHHGFAPWADQDTRLVLVLPVRADPYEGLLSRRLELEPALLAPARSLPAVGSEPASHLLSVGECLLSDPVCQVAFPLQATKR